MRMSFQTSMRARSLQRASPRHRGCLNGIEVCHVWAPIILTLGPFPLPLDYFGLARARGLWSTKPNARKRAPGS